MYKNYIDLLKHILVECEYIEDAITPIFPILKHK